MKENTTSYRLTRLTLDQIDKLAASTGHSKANVIATAIDRMFQEETQTMTAPTYYIEVDTYWQNAPSYFVGPFDNREAAEAWHAGTPDNANVWLSTSFCGGDIKSAWRIYPNALSKTNARKRGMRDDFENGYNVLPPSTQPTAIDLLDAKRSIEMYT